MSLNQHKGYFLISYCYIEEGKRDQCISKKGPNLPLVWGRMLSRLLKNETYSFNEKSFMFMIITANSTNEYALKSTPSSHLSLEATTANSSCVSFQKCYLPNPSFLHSPSPSLPPSFLCTTMLFHLAVYLGDGSIMLETYLIPF